MTSLRNSIHRRNHKERSQLAHRAKLGFLEKHKDYVKRAKDYHSKQDRLTRLRQKAAERNKDEFYFSMTKEKTKRGIHVKDRGNVALPADVVKVLKTQDENYIRTMRVAGLKKIDKIKAQLTALIDLVSAKDPEENSLDPEELEILQDAGIISAKFRKHSQRHIVFVENQVVDIYPVPNYVGPSYPSSPNVMDGDTNAKPVDLGWVEPDATRLSKKRKSVRNDDGLDGADFRKEMEGQAMQHRQRLLKELSARLVRDKQMQYAVREFEMQRLMMGKGARKRISAPEKLGDDSDEDEDALDARGGRSRKTHIKKSDETYKPRVYKWRIERKR
ncbi:u3 small nucleolar RNA-associated protein 11 [Lentinula aff. lateritia]|uniref:U3 small nucleolar RNA-associated protein 11 n=1 Tax=Lentinula aff. lateritia TaxID=2804960 RepID=A0ACC1U2Y9_9AGAR|nr:u3 small nucleolar RNA-associated protein 11 [Lentinula aff. lateritia]